MSVWRARTRVDTAALPSLASAQTEISRQFILICDQTEPCAVSPAPPLQAWMI